MGKLYFIIKICLSSPYYILSLLLLLFIYFKDLLCSPQDILGEQGGLVRVAVTVQELVLRSTKA